MRSIRFVAAFTSALILFGVGCQSTPEPERVAATDDPGVSSVATTPARKSDPPSNPKPPPATYSSKMKPTPGVAPPSTPGAQQMYATCRTSCVSEGFSEKLCVKNCDCHLEKMREGLTEDELESMILIATSGAPGADRVRRWMVTSSLECQDEVLGVEARKGPGATR